MPANLLEAYLRDLYETRSSGEATGEIPYYAPLRTLLSEAGKELKPKVICVLQLKNRGAGQPDGGLYTPDQFQKLGDGEPLAGQKPSRGAIEAKGTRDDAFQTARSLQVIRYLAAYGQVLVTNLRDFVLVGRDREGNPLNLESFRLAEDEKEFWKLAAHPKKAGRELGERLVEFLKRVMLSRATLADPKDVAWLLASYARDAKLRIEEKRDLPALATIRTALEQALGLKFEGEKGEHFYRSTLVQTLFYGVFSAWVLWGKQHPPTSRERFEWKSAQWSLHVPMIRALFEQVATPGQLRDLGVVEVLDWTEGALNRVDRANFFQRFEEHHAVQYFYEPFLEAFDPDLRKELGVWYTPHEIVKYMVARTDRVLREELHLEDGLADKNVYVLDPACGTGAYLVEVLNTIAATLKQKGGDALDANDVKRAAMERVFGFEILPAPFVISHLQLGLLLQNLGAPLSEAGDERAGVYLTNSLTGWEPPKGPKQHLVFPEMEKERDAADKVKRETKILVIIGNPPYNGFAGVGMAEERALSDAYRETKRAAKPQGQGLNDLYVRFFRMAEHKIVDDTGRGIVCFISNFSWLNGLSHPAMRERYLEVFDRVWIDCLNGDSRETGKTTPDGRPDPSVFSAEQNREGIQLGTAIALLARTGSVSGTSDVLFRNFWGTGKRADLLASLSACEEFPYDRLAPPLELGLPFRPVAVQHGYLSWPRLVDLLTVWSPGVNTSRDEDLVSIDKDALTEKIGTYLNPEIANEQISKLAPSLMRVSGRFDALATRAYLLTAGASTGKVIKYAYRPFDRRHLYWHPETKLLDEKREDLFACSERGAAFLTSRQKAERQNEGTPFYLAHALPDRHLTRPGCACFPLIQDEASEGQAGLGDWAADPTGTLSAGAQDYLRGLGIGDALALRLGMHVLAIGYSSQYLRENLGAIRQGWPRIPLPATEAQLLASSCLGMQLAALLDTEHAVKGVTSGTIRPELRAIGNIAAVHGKAVNPETDLEITAGWGHAGKGGVTMPGTGKATERDYTAEEREAIANGAAALGLTPEQALEQLGDKTCDVYLNDRAYWRNVPIKVWEYTIGGYQVMKKWLSYREAKLLGRAITPDEAREVRDMARRIAAICLLQPQLDANYESVKANTYPWPSQGKN